MVGERIGIVSLSLPRSLMNQATTKSGGEGLAMTEKASVTNHVNKHWVFTFVVGFHYYIWNESEVGDTILCGGGC